jgi:hypothetical protein
VINSEECGRKREKEKSINREEEERKKEMKRNDGEKSIAASYSGGPAFSIRPEERLSCDCVLSWVSSVPPGKYGDRNSVRSQALPSTFFQIYNSLIILYNAT